MGLTGVAAVTATVTAFVTGISLALYLFVACQHGPQMLVS